MIAVDTNILVYAHREDSPWHDTAYSTVVELAEGRALWAIPWPCIHEFLAIVTHPRIFSPPTPQASAVDQVEAWIEAPSLILLAELEGYWPQFRKMIEAGRVTGGQIHDARVAALCSLHGVRELWTADRDFTRFPDLSVRNPLIA
ncbi:MAG: PIN domain-containing protein [Proteobacteria bacterium]|nr:PIN domain-containing protein [Pseudomonadota bacterium]MCK5657142.1 PIN domain-containing protein [Deltaproteobacteria bacterium]